MQCKLKLQSDFKGVRMQTVKELEVLRANDTARFVCKLEEYLSENRHYQPRFSEYIVNIFPHSAFDPEYYDCLHALFGNKLKFYKPLSSEELIQIFKTTRNHKSKQHHIRNNDNTFLPYFQGIERHLLMCNPDSKTLCYIADDIEKERCRKYFHEIVKNYTEEEIASSIDIIHKLLEIIKTGKIDYLHSP